MFFSSAPVVLTGSLATLSADSTSPYGTACAPAPEYRQLPATADGVGCPWRGFGACRGLGECVRTVRDLCRGRGDVPLLVLGGGGYNSTNAARAFTYFTSLLLDKVLPSGHDADADDDHARESARSPFVSFLRLHV